MNYCRLYDKTRSASCLFFLLILIYACVGCGSSVREARQQADSLNHIAYNSRYKNLETTYQCAQSAYDASVQGRYPFGQCDALLNLSFYHIARMQYATADSLLRVAGDVAPDNISRLCIEVLEMRLCQRRSLNKEFFVHKFQAEQLISRIHNTIRNLTQHQREHFTWARSEYAIVLSAYLYYLGHEEEASRVLLDVADDQDIYLQADTAQWLSYLYNVGSGGILRDMPATTIVSKEIDYLLQCYISASHLGYIFWEANSLQSLSEHLVSQSNIDLLRRTDAPSLRYLSESDVTDSLLSRHLAEKSLDLFVRYGDIYQSAAAWRTLSDSYFEARDYEAMMNCLLNATSDTLIYQAPTIVSTINERLCIAFSAINEKPTADYLRNEYLDIQDSIRQDRELEARADALMDELHVLQFLVISILVVSLVLAVVLFVLLKYRKKHSVERRLAALTDRVEELQEQEAMLTLQISDARRLNIEEHAKITMVQSMQPLIDRMHIASQHDLDDEQTLEYLAALCRSVEQGNDQLTKWIQLRKGSVKIRVETFPVQQLFDVIALNTVSFTSKGITLNVLPTDISIKADRTLTLFILNTLVDNARKFTPSGGTITISCQRADVEGYAVISVADTGKGMEQEECDHLFEYRVIDNGEENLSKQKSHGFGLMNCRGIIDRYRKSSALFSQAAINAESQSGKGTTISFRLPLVARLLLAFILTFAGIGTHPAMAADNVAPQSADVSLLRANAYCDSMYVCNIDGRYAHCLSFADSCRAYLNAYYLAQGGTPRDTLSASSGNAELKWLKHGFAIDYSLLLAMRNEAAVAALALHEWDVYKYNNHVYTALYHELSADSSLNDYYRRMQRYESYGNLALIILACLILTLLYIFYRFYVRDLVVARDDYRRQISDLEARIAVLESEHNRLHVAISIAENCLSTIKHETMYYPSRIAHLIGVADEENTLRDTVNFYRTLYVLLSSHCQRLLSDAPMKIHRLTCQELIDACPSSLTIADGVGLPSSSVILGNTELLQYLFLILKKKNGGASTLVAVEHGDTPDYLTLVVECPGNTTSDAQLPTIFHVETHDPDYLILKQIVREIGEATFRYASGITARRSPSSVLTFRIVLPVVGL